MLFPRTKPNRSMHVQISGSPFYEPQNMYISVRLNEYIVYHIYNEYVCSVERARERKQGVF